MKRVTTALRYLVIGNVVTNDVDSADAYICYRRLRFSSDADIVRLTNARIIIIIIK